jgi:hypothetical protein
MRASSNDFQAQYFGIQSGGSRTSQSANLIYIYIYKQALPPSHLVSALGFNDEAQG